MKYKIGDKVKIILWNEMESEDDVTPSVGLVGEITQINGQHHPYHIRFGDCTGSCWGKRENHGCSCTDDSFFEEELELVMQPGEQLLFKFMDEK